VQVDVARVAGPFPARVTVIRRLLCGLPDSCVWNRSSSLPTRLTIAFIQFYSFLFHSLLGE
jgi:hypothetical protein